ncbi:unnamed protein product, partial [Thlaspi arvense]
VISGLCDVDYFYQICFGSAYLRVSEALLNYHWTSAVLYMCTLLFTGVEVKAGQPLKVKPEEGSIIHISQAALGEVKKEKGNDSVHLHLKINGEKLVVGTLSAEKFPQITFDLVFEKEFELSHEWKNGSVYFCGYSTDNAFGYPFYSFTKIVNNSLAINATLFEFLCFLDHWFLPPRMMKMILVGLTSLYKSLGVILTAKDSHLFFAIIMILGSEESDDEEDIPLSIANNGKVEPKVEEAKLVAGKGKAAKPESSAEPKKATAEPKEEDESDEDDESDDEDGSDEFW